MKKEPISAVLLKIVLYASISLFLLFGAMYAFGLLVRCNENFAKPFLLIIFIGLFLMPIILNLKQTFIQKKDQKALLEELPVAYAKLIKTIELGQNEGPYKDSKTFTIESLKLTTGKKIKHKIYNKTVRNFLKEKIKKEEIEHSCGPGEDYYMYLK